MTTVTRPRIKLIETETIDTIGAKLGISKKTVYEALCFFNNSARAREARKYAIEHGGVVIQEDIVI